MLPPLKRHFLCLALALSAGPLSAQTAAAGAGASAPTQAQRTTVEQDNLWDIAGQLAPAAGATRQQVMVAVLRRNPDAFVKGNIHRLRRGVPLVLPGRDEVLAEDRAAAVALVADHLKAMKAGTVLAPLAPRGAVAGVPSAAPVPAPASAPAAPVPAPAPKPDPVPAPEPTPEPTPTPAPPPAAPAPPPASASAAVPTPEAPPVPASEPASAASATAEGVAGSSSSRLIPLLLVLGGVTGAVILWRRRRAGYQPDPAAPDFSPSLSATRSPGPRVFDISNAAAEMARSVETSQVVTQLVRTDTVPASDESGVDFAAQAAIKLEIARASLEVGRHGDARVLLQAVVREGSGRHQAEAAEILARMG